VITKVIGPSSLRGGDPRLATGAEGELVHEQVPYSYGTLSAIERSTDTSAFVTMLRILSLRKFCAARLTLSNVPFQDATPRSGPVLAEA
jgi:hypothetical protein